MTYSKEIIARMVGSGGWAWARVPWVGGRLWTLLYRHFGYAVEILEGSLTFVLTGDIPAVVAWLNWLNWGLIFMAKRSLIAPDHCWFGQTSDDLDSQGSQPNSFNIERTGRVTTRPTIPIWIAGFGSTKYEVDSYCYRDLAYLLWMETGETSQFDETLCSDQGSRSSSGQWNKVLRIPLIALFGIQIVRKTRWWMTALGWISYWQGWPGRLSSKKVMTAVSSYLIPSNMFTVVVLGYVQKSLQTWISRSESIIADTKRTTSGGWKGMKKTTPTPLTARARSSMLFSRRFGKC